MNDSESNNKDENKISSLQNSNFKFNKHNLVENLKFLDKYLVKIID
ncbi:MAG: hypothetical protein FWF57_05185 [Defluviitaleaceae bacterium]|nr:hypothetical protein [Defluviitaleaceae bacterium]